ncbi:hypothetical protein GCM10009662_36800 [Catellatospora coxensis]|uniref:WD40 repeat protein n=1 Tax=Catellatospora coxensis TaxID=310354 RepID=A0A8J3KYA7_9ACTN|nr:hypothetical protein Cco03nite_43790 [Catellatospora coxensis]
MLVAVLAGCGSPPPGAMTPSAGPNPAPSVAPSRATLGETPQRLAGGWQVIAAGDRLLDRARNAYVAANLPKEAVLDPTGRRHAIGGGKLNVVMIAGGKTLTVERSMMLGFSRGLDPWSPDGNRLVATINRKDPFAIGFAVLDVTTGKVAEHWIDRTKYECSSCSFVFTRDGKEVAMPLADRSQGEAAELVRSLQLFDARTGKPTRSLPVKAMPQSPFAWSPDGSRVVARPDQIKEEDMQLIDTATGEAKPFPYTAVWATADELLAKFDDGVLTLRPDGTVIADASLATPLRGPLVLGPPAA